jgi:tetratricopeptide (TPR) repeat protein
MAEIRPQELEKRTRDLYEKGISALERKNYDYSVDLFLSVLKLEPRLLEARKHLRSAEIQRLKGKKKNAFLKALSGASSLTASIKAQSLVKAGKGPEAVMACEELLKGDPTDINNVKLFAKAAAISDLPEAAVQLLEVASNAHPSDVSLLNILATFYMKMGRTRSARDCFERICELVPNDPDALKCLKDALAMDSMNTDGWSEATSYKDIMKDKDEAELLEKESKAVKSDGDVASLIADTEKKIADEPGNINYYRQLAKLYAQIQEFEKAIRTLQKAIEMNPGDPELDQALATLSSENYDHQITQLRDAGDEEAAQAKEQEKAQFVFDDLQQRVQSYPNDAGLRYEWGKMLYENDYFNEAIQALQISQRNPKHRIRSLYHMAMCFKEKQQLDLAIDQLETAMGELYTMDETKKDVLYQLGGLSEELNDLEKAASYYKQIYQVDIGYKDVTEKIEKIYNASSEE